MITALIIIVYIILGLITTKTAFVVWKNEFDAEDPEAVLCAVFITIIWPVFICVYIVYIIAYQLFKRIL